MPKPSVILIYGHEPLLLMTRRRIFEQSGYTVVTATSLGEVERNLDIEAIALLLVCQTLSDQEVKTAIGLAHRSQPAMKCLVMSKHGERVLHTAQETEFLISAGPRALLDSTRTLIGEPQPSFRS